MSGPDAFEHISEKLSPTITRHEGPRWQIAPGVYGLRLVMVNVYFIAVEGTDQWVLVDTGLPMMASSIQEAAAEWFGKDSVPSAILLTHGHIDHVGSLKALLETWKCPVYAHPMEMAYLNGQASYAPPDPWVGGAMALTSPLFSRGPIDVGESLATLPVDGTVPFLPGWRWISTPGHSPGHVSFYRESDGTLIAGDVFVTTRQESLLSVAAQTQHVHGPPAYFTHDWMAAKESVLRLIGLAINVAATGHGTPMAGAELRTQLYDLAQHFDERAVPRRGRYVGRPVRYELNGPVDIPPAILPSTGQLMVGAAMAGAMLAILLASDNKKSRNEQ